MDVFSLTFGEGMDLDSGLCGIVFDELSGAGFPEGKIASELR